jgi:poly-gamma-glutamate capsule biosynthesis protein CapA/YwtB (metallophosphatase superfamily)
VKRAPLAAVLGLLAVAIALPMSGGQLGFGEMPAASPARPGASPSEAALASPSDSATPAPTVAPTPEPTATPEPMVEVPIVPVVEFRSTAIRATRAEVTEILTGVSERYTALELVEADAEAILEALGDTIPDDPDNLILVADAETVAADLAEHRDRLAFLRADQVGPGVRALQYADRSLFGVDRLTDLAEWRLNARLPAERASADPFDPGATWTLFAGGDILLDRGVHQTLVVNGAGPDFPFDGGSAEITSRYCCSSFGWVLPRTQRTGDEGAMRNLIERADIAIANFENPAPDNHRWHTSGTVFHADPDLIDGLVDAGIDYVSLANNHIGDAGNAGILQTIANMEARGMAYSGAGEDLDAARKPAMLEANGVTVAVLGYDAIARAYHAAEGEPGSAALVLVRVKNDIKWAREAGADVVIVFPHWGVEYRATPTASQQELARDIIDAGADMIIGNHAHWAAAMEVHEGKPIWYALGNFVFDQTWSEPTMEGVTLELTFEGTELVQAGMRPHIILDKAQPNFLEPSSDGQVVLTQIYDASEGLLPW